MCGGPIQFDCWRIVWFVVDTCAANVLRPANLESPRDRSGIGPCIAGVACGCPDWITPSGKTFWLPHSLAFPTNRSRPCHHGCPPHGTDTPTGRQSERRSRPNARSLWCISAFLVDGGRSSDRTFGTNARPLCGRPIGRVRPSFPRRCEGLAKSVSTNGRNWQ